jgi:hypothetical protein
MPRIGAAIRKGGKMTISPETINMLLRRAGGKCECTMTECSHHVGRCKAQLGGDWQDWHAHPISPSGADNLGNLIAMCQDCYRNTEHRADPNQNDFVRVS